MIPVALVAFTAGLLLGLVLGRRRTSPPVVWQEPVHMPEPAPGVAALVRAGRKLDAVRAYREATGRGLKESKDAVDALERELARTP